MTSIDDVGQRPIEAVAPPADELVPLYVDPEGLFAGTTFDTLGENPQNDVVIEDLLAVTLLDVRCTPLAVRRLLGEDRREISRLL